MGNHSSRLVGEGLVVAQITRLGLRQVRMGALEAQGREVVVRLDQGAAVVAGQQGAAVELMVLVIPQLGPVGRAAAAGRQSLSMAKQSHGLVVTTALKSKVL